MNSEKQLNERIKTLALAITLPKTKNKVRKFKQLSLFTDQQVKRSFLSRFTRNPKSEMIEKFRLQNMHNLHLNHFYKRYREDEITFISFNLHQQNKNNLNVTKHKGRYFYETTN